MNLITDIKNILVKHKDKEHHLQIVVDDLEIKVYLIYDPELEYQEDTIIPIVYDFSTGIVYISDSEYRDKYKACDYGIDLHEISIIKDIMEYLEKNNEKLRKMVKGFNLRNRFEGGEEDD